MLPSRSLPVRRASLLLIVATIALGLMAGSASALPALFDFGDGPVLSGWAGVDPASPSATSEGIDLVLSAVLPAGFDFRDRGGNGNGGGAESDMWRDFIFAVPDPPGDDGLLISLSGLTPGSTYAVTVWSFDSSGAQVDSRLSSWNGETYSFRPKGDLPETLDDYFVSFEITADAGGLAQVLGDSLEVSDPGVFINGMQVALVPEPGTALLVGLGMAGLAARRNARVGRVPLQATPLVRPAPRSTSSAQ